MTYIILLVFSLSVFVGGYVMPRVKIAGKAACSPVSVTKDPRDALLFSAGTLFSSLAAALVCALICTASGKGGTTLATVLCAIVGGASSAIASFGLTILCAKIYKTPSDIPFIAFGMISRGAVSALACAFCAGRSAGFAVFASYSIYCSAICCAELLLSCAAHRKFSLARSSRSEATAIVRGFFITLSCALAVCGLCSFRIFS